jgi:hypothetical protein
MALTLTRIARRGGGAKGSGGGGRLFSTTFAFPSSFCNLFPFPSLPLLYLSTIFQQSGSAKFPGKNPIENSQIPHKKMGLDPSPGGDDPANPSSICLVATSASQATQVLRQLVAAEQNQRQQKTAAQVPAIAASNQLAFWHKNGMPEIPSTNGNAAETLTGENSAFFCPHFWWSSLV